MPADPHVEELLEQLLEIGGTPEEVCRARPELLSWVRAGLQRLRAVEDEIGAMFPVAGSIGDAAIPVPSSGPLGCGGSDRPETAKG